MTSSVSGIDFSPALRSIKDQGLYRELDAIDGAQGPEISIGGRLLINFCSNDYLGLANDVRLQQALHAATDQYGIGSGASALICGRSQAHAELEEFISSITGRDRALVFSSGYLANLAVVSTLGPGRNGVVIQDRLNHASLIDGALLNRARLRRYRHADTESLETILRESPAGSLVVTDAVFSMDGDHAPLARIAGLCRQYGALLAVDDAHGFGVLGSKGKGSLSLYGLSQKEVPVLVLTFGKAVGVSGACVAGPAGAIEMLVQKARPYIYSTALPPALAATITASLKLVQAAQDRREHLSGLIACFREGAARCGLPVLASDTPIQPLMLGTNNAAMGLGRRLRERGILVAAIRPPTVPANQARLRITLTAAHTQAQVDTLLAVLAEEINRS